MKVQENNELFRFFFFFFSSFFFCSYFSSRKYSKSESYKTKQAKIGSFNFGHLLIWCTAQDFCRLLISYIIPPKELKQSNDSVGSFNKLFTLVNIRNLNKYFTIILYNIIYLYIQLYSNHTMLCVNWHLKSRFNFQVI